MTVEIAKPLLQERSFAHAAVKRNSRSPSPTSDSTQAPPSVFFDLDGTLVSTEMPYVCYAFVFGLPNAFQRWVKLILSLPVGLVVILCSLFDPAVCVKILGWLSTMGVSKEDAEHSASTAVLRACQLVVRPALIAEIKYHQSQGRTVAILTGGLEALVGPFCRSLGCVCIGTKSVLDPTGAYYTGSVGEPNIGAEKIAHVAKSGFHIDELYGYGNSKSDIPFLALTGNPYPVHPDKKLHKHAVENAWNTRFVDCTKECEE